MLGLFSPWWLQGVLRIKQHPTNSACNKLTIVSNTFCPVPNVPVTTRILTLFKYGTPDLNLHLPLFTLDCWMAMFNGLDPYGIHRYEQPPFGRIICFELFPNIQKIIPSHWVILVDPKYPYRFFKAHVSWLVGALKTPGKPPSWLAS